ncbi:Hypothetical predicted protein [Marmota monax]|nr:Hypothetical predicted protein [Marmota monax]
MKADVYKRKWEQSLAFRLQHPPSAKMWHLKLLAVLMICLLLLGQADGSPISELSSGKRRSRRMTPFWRGVSLRPIGASCRNDSECITRL